MIHLRSIAIQQDTTLPDDFPFNVPVIKSLTSLSFTSDVTFFVGENGSGKSTLLETIGVAAALPTIGSQNAAYDETLASVRELSKYLKWTWSKRVRHGFFMRSEDFFGFAKRIAQTSADMRRELESDRQQHSGQSAFAQQLGKMPFAREYHALKQLYGDGLDVQSHGESYFKLFRSRFKPDGLYLMDEPEAPLSPMRQLSLMAMLNELIKQNAQFIIATHSPILLAYPDATIYNFDNDRIEESAYDELEHVNITRDFLNNPSAYLRHLLD